MNRALTWLVLATMLLISVPSQAQPQAKRFLQGLQAYEKGDYAAAAEHFGAIAEAGVRNGELYYNLGNTYLKMGELGRARLWYERAARLLPRDPDLNFNRDYAASRVKDAGEEAHGGISKVLFFWYFLLDARTLRWMALGANALFWILLAIRRIIGRRWLSVGTGSLAVLALVLLVSVGVHYGQERFLRYGVVIPEQISVRSGLTEKSTELFVLHAGTRVRIDAQRPEGFRIRFSDGKIGWVRQGDLEAV